MRASVCTIVAPHVVGNPADESNDRAAGSGTFCTFRWGERLSRRSLAKADPREPDAARRSLAEAARQESRPTKTCDNWAAAGIDPFLCIAQD